MDRDNKRWYAAWTQQFPAGTPEGDAAFSQITTEQGVAAPVALQIATAVPQPNHSIVVTLETTGGAHATTRELLHKLPGDADFGHSQPIAAAGAGGVRPPVVIGPFAPGTVVEIRTRMANSTPGVVLGDVVSAVA